jgi:hypothetical protein
LGILDSFLPLNKLFQRNKLINHENRKKLFLIGLELPASTTGSPGVPVQQPDEGAAGGHGDGPNGGVASCLAGCPDRYKWALHCIFAHIPCNSGYWESLLNVSVERYR